MGEGTDGYLIMTKTVHTCL